MRVGTTRIISNFENRQPIGNLIEKYAPIQIPMPVHSSSTIRLTGNEFKNCEYQGIHNQMDHMKNSC